MRANRTLRKPAPLPSKWRRRSWGNVRLARSRPRLRRASISSRMMTATVSHWKPHSCPGLVAVLCSKSSTSLPSVASGTPSALSRLPTAASIGFKIRFAARAASPRCSTKFRKSSTSASTSSSNAAVTAEIESIRRLSCAMRSVISDRSARRASGSKLVVRLQSESASIRISTLLFTSIPICAGPDAMVHVLPLDRTPLSR